MQNIYALTSKRTANRTARGNKHLEALLRGRVKVFHGSPGGTGLAALPEIGGFEEVSTREAICYIHLNHGRAIEKLPILRFAGMHTSNDGQRSKPHLGRNRRKPSKTWPERGFPDAQVSLVETPTGIKYPVVAVADGVYDANTLVPGFRLTLCQYLKLPATSQDSREVL